MGGSGKIQTICHDSSSIKFSAMERLTGYQSLHLQMCRFIIKHKWHVQSSEMNDTSGKQKIARHMEVVPDEGSQGLLVSIQGLDTRAFTM